MGNRQSGMVSKEIDFTIKTTNLCIHKKIKRRLRLDVTWRKIKIEHPCEVIVEYYFGTPQHHEILMQIPPKGLMYLLPEPWFETIKSVTLSYYPPPHNYYGLTIAKYREYLNKKDLELARDYPDHHYLWEYKITGHEFMLGVPSISVSTKGIRRGVLEIPWYKIICARADGDRLLM